jgi:glycosyltransferase involved in cell wall biosynthesis
LEPGPTIIFWQPIASPHQEAFLEAVAERCAAYGVEVLLGVERDLPPDRSAQGWQMPSHKHVKVVDISIPANHAALAAHDTAASLHVFSGFFSHPLVSAGQLIHRKGIDLLLRACGELPATGWRLDCYGDGPARPRLEQVVRSRGLADRVAFHGVVSNDGVRAALAQSDCAVLPSRFDGWGMLVNESLAAGTPVICTTACGAAMLVSSARLGSVVKPDSVAALSASLADAIERGPVQPQERAGIHADASAGMSATWAAARFDSLLADAGLPLASFARVES